MDYKILELDEFEIMGVKYELSNSLIRNINLAKRYWMKFNNKLRRDEIYLGRNWCKYAFIIEEGSKLFYYISVPKKDYVPEDFMVKTIPSSRYLTINHIGSMNKLKLTMDSVYSKINDDNIVLNDDCFSYFEKYNYKFHWNKPDSVIGIYVPIK